MYWELQFSSWKELTWVWSWQPICSISDICYWGNNWRVREFCPCHRLFVFFVFLLFLALFLTSGLWLLVVGRPWGVGDRWPELRSVGPWLPSRCPLHSRWPPWLPSGVHLAPWLPWQTWHLDKYLTHSYLTNIWQTHIWQTPVDSDIQTEKL